jgi:drug/metabolite transporter, DME family
MDPAAPVDPRSRRHGTVFLAIAAALWGTVGVAAVVTYRQGGADPLGIAFWRLAIGGVAVLPLLLRNRRRTSRTMSGADRRGLALVGGGLAAYQACFFVAVQLAGVSIATLIALGLAPVLVPLVDRVVGHERPARRTLVAIGLALLGLVGLVGVPTRAGQGVLLGAVFAAAAAAGYTTVIVTGKVIGTRMGSDRLALLSLSVAALLLLPIVAVTGRVAIGTDPVVLASVLYIGLVPTALAYWLFFVGLDRVSGPVASVMTLMEPAVATVLAVVLLGERLPLTGWLGGILLLSAVAMVAVAGTRRLAPH